MTVATLAQRGVSCCMQLTAERIAWACCETRTPSWVLRVPVLCEQVTSARFVRTVATLRTPWHGLSSCKWRQELLSGLLCTCSHGMGCHLRYHTLGRCCPPWCDAGHGHGVGCAGCLPAIGIGVVRPALLLSARPWRGLFAPAIGIGVVRPALQPSI